MLKLIDFAFSASTSQSNYYLSNSGFNANWWCIFVINLKSLPNINSNYFLKLPEKMKRK